MHGGGAIRTAAVMQYLARRYRLDAIFFREAGSTDPRAALPAGLVEDTLLIDLPRHSRSAPARLVRNLGRAWRDVPPLNDRFAGHEASAAAFARGRQWDTAIVEHFWCASYGEPLRGSARRLVLDLHNIESALYTAYARSAHRMLAPLYQRFADSAARWERELLPRFDTVLTASEADRERAGTGHVYPNTIPARSVPATAPQPRVIFSGNLEYQPNLEAVAHFARNIWPELSATHPGLEWWILGKNPNAVRDVIRGAPRITLTGPVDDAIPYLAGSLAAVVPLLSGSGTRIKILEAWMAGVPVVSTSTGAEGLGCRDGTHLLIADAPRQFTSQVTRLIEDTALRERIGGAGRQFFAEYFTWDAGWRVLELLGI